MLGTYSAITMKFIIIRIFAILLSAAILFFAQIRFSGALEWLAWSNDNYEVRTEVGFVHKAYWSGGTRSCQCTVLVLQTSNGIIHFNTKIGETKREAMNRDGNKYLVNYHPLGNGENRPIDIINIKTNDPVHKAELYKGYGVALSSTIFSITMLCIGIILILVSAGIIKTDDQIRT